MSPSRNSRKASGLVIRPRILEGEIGNASESSEESVNSSFLNAGTHIPCRKNTKGYDGSETVQYDYSASDGR
jgi:hypothetical protein